MIFDPNGGAVTQTSKSVTYGSAVGELPEATWGNHIFNGWFTEQNGGTQITSSTTVTSDVTYYAHWTNQYIITYKPGTNGIGNEQSDIKTHDIDLTLKDAIFTRTGYSQTGWATSDGGSKVYGLGGSYTENSDVILYPTWVAGTYTITYNPGAYGTGSQQTATKIHDIELTLKGAIFTRTGYTQAGWETSEGSGKAYELSASYTENRGNTLYPFWRANKYTLTINPNGGTYNGSTSNTVHDNALTYGSTEHSTIGIPTYAGHTFSGWYTSSTGGV